MKNFFKNQGYFWFVMFLSATFMFMFSVNAHAYEVPQDAVIKVYSKDGKLLGTMSRSTHKVVKLGTSKTVVVEKTVVQTITLKEPSKRQTSLLIGGGVGKDGLKTSTDGNNYTIEEKDSAIGTLGVCSLKDGGGVCGTASTNETFGVQFIIPIGK